MTRLPAISQWVMRAAVRQAPPARHEWALAMQREFDTLEDGHVAWAVGCLATVAGWRLRGEALYLLLLVSALLLVEAVPRLEFDLLWYRLISRSAFIAFERDYAALLGILTPLPVAFLLGRYWPRRPVVTILLGCLLAQHVGGTLLAMRAVGGSFLSWWAPDATLYMLPPLVALAASLCVWCAGISLGAWSRLPLATGGGHSSTGTGRE